MKRLPTKSGARRPFFEEVGFVLEGLLVAPPSQPRTTQGSGPRSLLCSWYSSQTVELGSRPGPSPGSNSNHPRLTRTPGLLPGRAHVPEAPGPSPAIRPSPGREVPPRRGRRWWKGPRSNRCADWTRPPSPGQRPRPPAAAHGQHPPGHTARHVPREGLLGC